MRAVIFDLDGTLIDSAPDIAASVNRVLADAGLAALSLGEIRAMIGDGAKILLARAFAARGAESQPVHYDEFLRDYEAHPVVETMLYPGMGEALLALHNEGRRLGICTNKPVAVTTKILDALSLSRFFSIVIGGDSTPYRKPDPRHLAAALGGLEVAEAVMVGDHENDMQAAAGLGLSSIFCAWGYGQGQGDLRAETADELPGLIARLG